MIDIKTYAPVGDKKNSDEFNEYLPKIYERRISSGISDLVGAMQAAIVSVDADDGVSYLAELTLMTPYRFEAAYTSDTHNIYVLRCPEESAAAQPLLFVLEPRDGNYEDELTWMNRLYPNAAATPNARYVGEVFYASDINEAGKILSTHDVRFEDSSDVRNPFFGNPNFLFSTHSDYTGNRIGYTTANLADHASLDLGRPMELTAVEKETLAKVDAKYREFGFTGKLLGYDHMATRILAGEREDAILEFLTQTNYYFWGAYNISAMNSSTNVCRNPAITDDKLSPAKVFTANNTASFVNSFEGLPMPTEEFVRNYGRRMHHLAIEVLDGDYDPERVKNVDYVVEKLASEGVAFLNHVIGECKDSPNLKQIFSKHSAFSILITEYVERCHGFSGFFTKDNVAELTRAAGLDERREHGHVFD